VAMDAPTTALARTRALITPMKIAPATLPASSFPPFAFLRPSIDIRIDTSPKRRANTCGVTGMAGKDLSGLALAELQLEALLVHLAAPLGPAVLLHQPEAAAHPTR
jgi:hypothetical protein